MAATNVAASAEELLLQNGQYIKVHQPQPFFAEEPADGPSPKPKTFIYALVVRNAGGSVGSALDSLIALDYFIGTFEDIFVIQHTDCGALHFTGEDVKEDLKKHHRGRAEDIDALQFGGGLSLTLEERVRKNVQLIRDSPYIRDDLKKRTKGLIYDIKTGKLTELE